MTSAIDIIYLAAQFGFINESRKPVMSIISKKHHDTAPGIA